jgi:alpha-mannosidase
VVERKLHEVEALAAITGTDLREQLEPVWRDVLLGQFHDILPGSTIARVAREQRETLTRIEHELDAHASGLAATLPPGESTLLNLTSFARDEHVATPTGWVRATAAPYATATTAPAADDPRLTFADDAMSNGILSLRFGPSGEIVSCRDARGREHSAGGLSRIVLHRDPYVWPFNAWDIDPRYLTRTPRTLPLRHVGTVVDGPTIRRTQRYDSSRVSVEQTVVLESGSGVVRFDTRVKWHTRHRMLRAEFRPTHMGGTARCEIQFGHIERVTTENTPVEAAQFEVPAHKWIATDDGESGFAVLNDSKYGHRAKSGLISLNLLRAPTFPDRTADRGDHRFSYAFLPFAPGELGTVIREAYRLNHPLLPVTGARLPSMASTDDPGVVIETVKPAENGDGTVLRLYESLGRACTTRLRTALPHARATRTDLLERPIAPADLNRLSFRPFEVMTIHLEAP